MLKSIMNPTDDWTNLDNLSENEAKLLLRMAIANFRIIGDTVKNPLDNASYNPQGHATALGLAMGFLVNWEDRFRTMLPKSQLEERTRS